MEDIIDRSCKECSAVLNETGNLNQGILLTCDEYSIISNAIFYSKLNRFSWSARITITRRIVKGRKLLLSISTIKHHRHHFSIIFFLAYFICEFCHAVFLSRARLDRHQRFHIKGKPFLCIYCNEEFSYVNEFHKHRKAEHMSKKSFICQECTKTFSSRTELKEHSWRHTGLSK